MSKTYLYEDVEAEIVRGNWDAILGLFESVRMCAEGVPPEQEQQNKGFSSQRVRPYLGPDHSYGDKELPPRQYQGTFSSQGVYPGDNNGKGRYPNDVTDFATDQWAYVDGAPFSPTGPDYDGDNPNGQDLSTSPAAAPAMRPPARLPLNPLSWRGETYTDRASKAVMSGQPGNVHLEETDIYNNQVDLVPRPLTDREQERLVRDVRTGIEVATDIQDATFLAQEQGQEEIEQEFRNKTYVNM